MAKIISEIRSGTIHKAHKHTDKVAGTGLGYENYCFECGESLKAQDNKWTIHTCSECKNPLLWIRLLKYSYCPHCGGKFDGN